MKPDFSGYATKAGLKCSDGRTITPEAFKHMDGKTVPLVWQHGHNEPANVLGHAVLEARDDGMYCYGFFNGSQSAQQAKALVQHKDITSLSIYANQLVERASELLADPVHEQAVDHADHRAGEGGDGDHHALLRGIEPELLGDDRRERSEQDPDHERHVEIEEGGEQGRAVARLPERFAGGDRRKIGCSAW